MTQDPQTVPGTQALTPFEQEMAALIVETLHLEMAPEDIAPEEQLFGEGLGLDSIDALELSLAISRSYGVNLKSDDANNPAIFASLRTLSTYVAAQRTA